MLTPARIEQKLNRDGTFGLPAEDGANVHVRASTQCCLHDLSIQPVANFMKIADSVRLIIRGEFGKQTPRGVKKRPFSG